MKKLTLIALGLVALAAVPASAADWSDTSFGYRTGSKFQEPANPESMKKDIFNLTHVSGYSLGSNFFSVDMLTSSTTDPSNNALNNANFAKQGAHEVYVSYKHNLNLGKVFDTKIDFGPVRGMDFSFGFDYAAKNTTFAPAVYKLMAGPTFNFKVPGFLSVSALYYKEKNHNAFGGFALAKGGTTDVVFDGTYQIAAAWGIPVALGPVNTSVKGFATFTGAKGKDGSGVQTKLETLFRGYWMFDISPVFGTKKGTWQIGPGVEYWDNKFGDPTFATVAEATASGTGGGVNPKTTCIMAALEIHF
jgi:nucleoside-specific outer membrane channel protein Tsx